MTQEYTLSITIILVGDILVSTHTPTLKLYVYKDTSWHVDYLPFT